MKQGSDFSCLLGENENRVPFSNELWVAESADAYPAFQGAACTEASTASFLNPLTALHSAIWDPNIEFKDTFTALGLANQLRGEVVLTCNSVSTRFSTPSLALPSRPSCLRTSHKSLKKRPQFKEVVSAVHVDRSQSLEPLLDSDADECIFMARAPRVRESPSSLGTDSDLEVHTPSSPHSFDGRLWRSVQVYDMHSNHARGRVQVQPSEATFAETRRLLGYTHHEVAEIFTITPSPRDLDYAHVQPLLLLRHDDLYFGDDRNRKAILVDVELHGPLPDSIVETDRYTSFLPSDVHRSILLRIAGVRSYCDMQAHRCLVWHKGRLIPSQYNGLIRLNHGDYIRVALPPFEEPDVPTHFAVRACQAGLTRSQLIDHFQIHGPDAGSFHSEVSAEQRDFFNLIDVDDATDEAEVQASVENLNRMFDEVQDQVEADLSSLLHTSFKVIPSFLGEAPLQTAAQEPRHSLQTCCPEDFCVTPAFLLCAKADDSPVDIGSAEPQCSFTDEFLQEVRARSQALEFQDLEMAEAADPLALSSQPVFVQHLHALFLATMPARPDSGYKIESWYTDHLRKQRCHNARTTFLGPDFHTWEQQLRLEWIDEVDPYHELDFVLVHPLPEDAEEGALAQLLLIQNPDARQSSIVLTIYDNDHDQGRPHSHAVVTTDRVSLQSILLVAEFQEFCPPEIPWSDCRLFFGDIEILPHRFLTTRHGFALRLHIHRPQEFDVEALRFAEDAEIRQALASAFADASHFLPQLASSSLEPAVAETITPVNALWCPDWHNSLASAFDTINEPETDSNLHRALVVTWYLNGQYEPQCGIPRTVRLSACRADWERTIIAAWTDHVDRRFPFHFHFVVRPMPATFWLFNCH